VGTSVAVVGPGAIGSTMAALLHAAGHHVLLCGHTPRDRVEVRPDDKDPIVIPGPVHTDPADVDGPVDVVLLAVKDTQNRNASGWLARLCDDRTVVCALQNGVEQIERVGPLCPSSEVVPAVVWFSAEPHPDGWVRLRTDVRLVLPESAGAHRLANLLRDTGVSVKPAHGVSVQRSVERKHRGVRRHYRLEPTAAGCRLTWVMAMKPQGVAALLGMSLGRPVMSWLFGEIPLQPA
jgi:2-dehydropantoate 2-reductase